MSNIAVSEFYAWVVIPNAPKQQYKLSICLLLIYMLKPAFIASVGQPLIVMSSKYCFEIKRKKRTNDNGNDNIWCGHWIKRES